MQLLTALVAVALLAEPAWVPARYRSGDLPPASVTAVSGGQVLVEASVSAAGAVSDVKPLRITAPFTRSVVDAVRGWRFEPAVTRRPVPSTVLVAAIFLPPVLHGPTVADPPADVRNPSRSAPFPIATPSPAFPIQARDGAAVLVELSVDAGGAVTETAIVRSAPPFDEPAERASRQWRFRPAVVDGAPVPARVYVVFVFRTPVL